MGDIKALCTLCGQRLGEIVCDNCGIYVCKECFDHKKGMCKGCAKGLQ